MSATFKDFQSIVRNVIDKREAAFADAIRSLAKYKFWMFGYHAAAWVKYNQLLKGTPWHQGNPFKRFVELAEIERGELDGAAAWEVDAARRRELTKREYELIAGGE